MDDSTLFCTRRDVNILIQFHDIKNYVKLSIRYQNCRFEF